MSGSGLLKEDIHSFISHKRASLPPCALEQLRDAILEDTSHSAIVMELSGLVHTNDHYDRSPVDYNAFNMPLVRNSNYLPPEDEKGMVRDDSCVRNLLPFKRNQSDLTNKNLSQDNQESQGYIHDGDLHVNAKRSKQNASCVNQPVEQISVPQHGNELAENSTERIGGVAGKGSQDAEKESQVGRLDECRSLGNDDGKFVATNRLGQSPDASANDEFQHKQCENTHSANKIPQDISGDGSHQYILVDEVSKDEHRQLKVTFDGAKDDGEQWMQLKIPNSGSFSGSQRNVIDDKAGGLEHLCKQGTSSDVKQYHHKKVDSMKKSRFLSSYFAAVADQTKPNCCFKCSKDGQVLVCSAVGCSLFFHEKCLGSLLSFDEKGYLCCPFCTCFHAFQRYHQAKKKASLVREELHLFINQIPKEHNHECG
ncbi:uncharacterized protein LOC110665936 isoform X2 [Hevea brasiliensis]|nr:uncharacterized protein LOC110665936 isoform X2 [Hevea brasiliensis]